MIKVRVKLEGKPRFTVPIPYFLLRIGGWIVSSRLLWRMVHSLVAKNTAAEQAVSWIPTSIERRVIMNLLKTVRSYKGLTVVEVTAQDGTEVSVKL